MKLVLSLIFVFVVAVSLRSQTHPLTNSYMDARISANGMIGLTSPSDAFEANIIKGSGFGRAHVFYRVPEGEWLSINQYNTTFQKNEDQSLSYMAKMGGWSILDFWIHFAENTSNSQNKLYLFMNHTINYENT